MAKQTCEDLYIRQIENSIRAIRLGVKSPVEANPAEWFEKLESLNAGMYQDLIVKYQNVVNDYNRKMKQKDETTK